ncbi:MAG: VanZ family protein [Firmicutes bacterium]|nr:VanZ family protein [Bacillota bacterium]
MTLNKLISWAVVLIWMALIFNLSSQVAEQSNQLSTGITKVIVDTVEQVAPKAEFDIESFNHMLRKNAHFFAYLVLGILVINALKRSGVVGFKGIILAFLICILYAISDEAHQMFVPGRGPGIRDVLIDSFGASVGIGVYLLINRRDGS